MTCADPYVKNQFLKSETKRQTIIFLNRGIFRVKVDFKIVELTVFSGHHSVF